MEGSPGSWGRSLSVEDVRRQLEGRLETVEAARERYAALESLLSGKKWKRRLHEQPEVLQAVLGHEFALGEALERVLRRAETDRWPEELPVLVTVRQVRALRERVEWLVQKRLGELAPSASAWSLTEALTRLAGLVPPPVSLELAPGEVLLREGTPASRDWRWLRAILRLLGLLVVSYVGMVTRSRLVAGLLGGVVLLATEELFARWVRGRYRLTSERLVWQPARGEPVQLPLRSIAEDGIDFTFNSSLRVVGEREIFMRESQPGRSTLALELELHRHPPLLGGMGPARREDVVCYPARLQTGTYEQPGHAVLCPGYVAFFPSDRGQEVLEAIIGRSSRLSVPFSVPAILEQLRYLSSEAVFDACVERAVAAARGQLWKPEDVLRYEPHTPARKKLHFQTIDRPQKSLSGKVARDQEERVERILSAWPRR